MSRLQFSRITNINAVFASFVTNIQIAAVAILALAMCFNLLTRECHEND